MTFMNNRAKHTHLHARLPRAPLQAATHLRLTGGMKHSSRVFVHAAVEARPVATLPSTSGGVQ